MRVSTSQLNRLALNSILEQQAKASRSQLEISSGKRIVTPSDDPVGTVKSLSMQRNLERLSQFERNSSLLQGRLAEQESLMTNGVNILQRVREIVVQGANASQGDESRQLLAIEVRQQLQSMLQVANTQDSEGRFIFQVWTKQHQRYRLHHRLVLPAALTCASYKLAHLPSLKTPSMVLKPLVLMVLKMSLICCPQLPLSWRPPAHLPSILQPN